MQIKTTLRFYLTPVRIATIKNRNNIIVRMREEKVTSYTAGKNVN
jgi:hypothetical protein